MKTIVFLGAPGAGKGTQAAKVAKETGFIHISTGDIFRAELKNNTELGKQAKDYMDKGELVPDTLVVNMVEQKVAELTDANGILLDGFPRNVEQARAMEGRIPVDVVINIQVNRDVLVNRLSSRRFCPTCQNTQPVSAGAACQKCGAGVIQRDDDKEEVILNRMTVYEQQTKPLIEYYDKQNRLVTINGDRDIDVVSADILKEVQK